MYRGLPGIITSPGRVFPLYVGDMSLIPIKRKSKTLDLRITYFLNMYKKYM